MAASSVRVNNLGSLDGGMHNPGSGIAFEIEMSECCATTPPIPKRVRQRLEETPESKFRSPASLEDIEVKLKEADLRRQQFHEWLANKARPKPRLSPTHSEHAESLAQRLEAKLSAAEHKRAELLAQEQTRLAKLHELRVAAKTEAQLRAEREREELGSKVEFRVQQAEMNRLALVEAERQRIAAVHERIAQSILQRTTQEGRDRDRIEALRATICQKIAAAEEKRAGLLEAEKNRAQACVLQARRVAKAVVKERELEMRKKKEKLEARLQRAKRQRAEYLMKRGGCRGSSHDHGHKLRKHGDRLCRKLTRCWRQFRGSRCTTYSLAQDFAACAINQELVISLPFEELASRITSPATLRGVTPLLARLESRLMLSCAGKSTVGHVEHLLKHLSPQRRKPGSLSGRTVGKKIVLGNNKGLVKENGRSQNANGVSKVSKEIGKGEEREMERYPARVFLCAYMILGQPDAVFSGRGGRETALADAAAKLLPEFEALISIILDGPSSTSKQSYSLDDASDKKTGWVSEKQTNDSSTLSGTSLQRPFSARLAAFDAAWCTYLYQFVAWKVKDAQSLEEDLTRMACQLEISMLQKCKAGSDLSHDSQAIRKQVLEDQKLLYDRIVRLTGAAGASRMEQALSEVRSEFNEAVENGTPLPSPFSSPSVVPKSQSDPTAPVTPFLGSKGSVVGEESIPIENRSKVVRSLFAGQGESQSFPHRPDGIQMKIGAHPLVIPTMSDGNGSAYTNEKIVNEMLHDQTWQQFDALPRTASEPLNSGVSSGGMSKLQAQIRSTMETAFWDGIMEGLLQTPPAYERVVILIAEIREDLQNIVPDNWKQDLQESMDLELVSQILVSGTNDFKYLRNLLDYAAGQIIKLGAPIRDSEAKAAHQSLLTDLSAAAAANEATQSSFANALVKGLRFVFNQLQVLKQDISSTRIRALAPLINGSAGFDYVCRAFASRHSLSTVPPFSVEELTSSLPRTAAWIREVTGSLEHERTEVEASLAILRGTNVSANDDLMTARLPSLPSMPMRTGGRIGVGGLSTKAPPAVAISNGEPGPRPVVWKSNDTILRLGALQIIQKLEPATEDNLPETLSLSAERLRACQNEFQRVIVMSTGLLVARQGLTGKGVQGAELDRLMQEGFKKLSALLSDPDVAFAQIGALLAQISAETASTGVEQDIATQNEFMTRVLTKSLSRDDPVFMRISVAVVSSIRAVLLLGKGPEGVALSEMALKRIGGSMLLDKVTKTADVLERISSVTCRVHEPWYSCFTGNVE